MMIQKMTKIKNFNEFQKTNEIFGKFAFELGKTLGSLSGKDKPKSTTRVTSFNKSVNTKADNDLGKEILIKLREMTKKFLLRWLQKQPEDFQKDWSKKYANDFIRSEINKQKSPNNKWPDIWDNGIITIDMVVDYIYEKGRENEIDWSYVYDPQKSPDLINLQSNNHYFFITEFNGNKFKVEIIKNSLSDYQVLLTQQKARQSGRMSGSFKSRDTTSGFANAPIVSAGFIGDESTKSELNIEVSLIKRIFSEAERVYFIINNTAKGNAMKP